MPTAAYHPKKHSIFESKHHACTACVGENGMPDFETYATGYFEAAKVLLRQVIDPKQNLTQDTLVYPILFNLRHGVELSIKHVTKALSEAKLPPSAPQDTHELKPLWSGLEKQAQPDRRLHAALAKLEPAVLQLHAADPLAQEFRYAERNDGVPSFKGRSLVDLVTVYKLTEFTAGAFDDLFGLAAQVRKERQHGSFTPELNRPELERLSRELPDASEWKNSKQFAEVKVAWMTKYQLSNRAFNRAVDFIRSHREFAGNVGLARPFEALTDDALDRLLSAALELLVAQIGRSTAKWSSRQFGDHLARAKFNSTGLQLSARFVGEVNALFYLGRDCDLSEEYEAMLQYHSRYTEPVEEDGLWPNFVHVFDKLNFGECVCRGLRMTGHPEMAAKFEPKFRRLNARLRKTDSITQL